MPGALFRCGGSDWGPGGLPCAWAQAILGAALGGVPGQGWPNIFCGRGLPPVGACRSLLAPLWSVFDQTWAGSPSPALARWGTGGGRVFLLWVDHGWCWNAGCPLWAQCGSRAVVGQEK